MDTEVLYGQHYGSIFREPHRYDKSTIGAPCARVPCERYRSTTKVLHNALHKESEKRTNVSTGGVLMNWSNVFMGQVCLGSHVSWPGMPEVRRVWEQVFNESGVFGVRCVSGHARYSQVCVVPDGVQLFLSASSSYPSAQPH